MRDYVQQRVFALVGEYVDYASGTNEQHPQYHRPTRQLFQQARKRRIDVVVVWRYDRFARSTQTLINALKEFHAFHVDFISYQESIDTTIPQGEMIFNVMASMAQFESSLISEKVKAGMARAKAQGKCISRPPLCKEKQQQIVELYRQKVSINKISKIPNIGYGTAGFRKVKTHFTFSVVYANLTNLEVVNSPGHKRC